MGRRGRSAAEKPDMAAGGVPSGLPEPDTFLDHITRNDPFEFVIRGHIWIEAALNNLLDELLVVPDQLPRLGFFDKVKLVVALGGIPQEDAKPYGC